MVRREADRSGKRRHVIRQATRALSVARHRVSVGKYGFTDLFVNGDLDLHASAKLGERKRQPDGTWSRRDWWNNDRWAANVSRMEKFDGPELMREKRP